MSEPCKHTHILLTFSSNCAIWLEVEGGDDVEQLHWGGVAFSMREQNRLVKRWWKQRTKTTMKSTIMTTIIKETEREKKLMIKSRLVLWVTEWGGDDLHEMCRNLIEEGLREEQRDSFHCEAERNWKKCLIGNWLRNAKGEWE